MPQILDKWKVLPHGPLQQLDEGILTVAGDLPMPLGNFPRRMTVVRLSEGRTAIFSAVSLPEPEMERIEELGQPSILIVPNSAHRLDCKVWKERYPDLLVLTPPGAKDAVSDVVRVDATSDILDDPEVSFQIVRGTGESESALLIRRASGYTLVCNDIIGHVTDPHGLGAQVMARLMGFGVHEPRVPRTAWFHIKDRRAFAEHLYEWGQLPYLQRIIVSHGEPITDDPVGILNRIGDEMYR